MQETGRILSQEATLTDATMRGPTHVQLTPRDVTNGRGWIYPEENELMKNRLQALEKRLRTLQTKPPAQPSNLQQTQVQMQQSPLSLTGPRTEQDIQFCREKVFTTVQQPVQDVVLENTCNNPATFRFNVCHDLADFTGMAMDEVVIRLARMKQFHFEEEHLFWNPLSSSQLAWYYSTSQSYLFANAIHGARTVVLNLLQKDVHEPVLDYSGGVGNSVLYLAMERGMKCQYFGIGMIEKSFAQFRVAKRGLEHMITFLHPWSKNSAWKFDPLQALPKDGSLGAILADDVLEHIPNYHHAVAAMVDSLKVGGVIIENTPFAPLPVPGADTRIHVHNGGISMAQAMGRRMVFREKEGYWEKLRA